MTATMVEQHMSTALTEVTEYPLEFFLEERYTVSEAMSLIQSAYVETEMTDKLPPSFNAVADHLMGWWFAYELMFRAYYRDGDKGICMSTPGDVREDIIAFAADNGLQDNIDQAIYAYTDDLSDGGQTFEMYDVYGKLQPYGEDFLHDVEYLLNASGLFFVQVDYEDPEGYTEFQFGRLPNHRELRLHNCPIVEVW